jgi:hypothetical protein
MDRHSRKFRVLLLKWRRKFARPMSEAMVPSTDFLWESLASLGQASGRCMSLVGGRILSVEHQIHDISPSLVNNIE